jgi:hypothetical protein
MRALWDMFDDAAGVAEEALERHGLPDRILAERTDNEYRLTMPGPDGRERRIVVFANVATLEGHISGGGHISTSETRATVNLVPAVHAGRIQWRVAASNHQISPRLVSDLFLSVFTDDPAATKRLESSFTTTP